MYHTMGCVGNAGGFHEKLFSTDCKYPTVILWGEFYRDLIHH